MGKCRYGTGIRGGMQGSMRGLTKITGEKERKDTGELLGAQKGFVQSVLGTDRSEEKSRSIPRPPRLDLPSPQHHVIGRGFDGNRRKRLNPRHQLG